MNIFISKKFLVVGVAVAVLLVGIAIGRGSQSVSVVPQNNAEQRSNVEYSASAVAGPAKESQEIVSSLSVSGAQEAGREIEGPSDAASDDASQEASDVFYNVIRAVDGDTIDVEKDGAELRLRLLGMDTPETVDPRKPVQCFGIEASNKAKELLSGKRVRLESDSAAGEIDKYGRTLRYVFLEDGTLFNKWMIENGYAHEYTYILPYRHQAEFKEAERRAQEAQRGLWSPDVCPAEPEQHEAAVATPTPIPESPVSGDTCVIKGNINGAGEKIYHVPGCGSYKVTKIDESRGERWFCAEADALAADWRKAKNCP